MTARRVFPLLLWASILVSMATALSAQELDLPALESGDEAALAQAMPALAEQAMAVYQEPDRGRYLETLFRLQWVAGRNEEAIASIRELRALRQGGPSKYPPLLFAQYEVLATAGMKQAGGMTLDEAVRQAFLEVFARLDDRIANRTYFSFGTNLDRLRGDWLKGVEAHKGQITISLADALALIRSFQVQHAYQILTPRAAGVIAEDEARRYVIDKDVLIKTPDGAQLAAMPESSPTRAARGGALTRSCPTPSTKERTRARSSDGSPGSRGATAGWACMAAATPDIWRGPPPKRCRASSRR